MTSAQEVATARFRSRVAKERFQATLAETRTRLSPKTLAQDALETAKQGTASAARNAAVTARQRPLAMAAAAGVVAIFFARKPLLRALRGAEADNDPRPRVQPPAPSQVD